MSYNIEARRLELKLTQEDVANMVGVTKATISKWEKGDISNMKRDKIVGLAKALKISPLRLVGINEDSTSDVTPIPIIGTIKCGEPILAEENIVGYIEEADSAIPSGKLFFLQAQGDSMHPTIPENSYVLIREQPSVEYGEIAAVLVNGDTEATLKRVKKQGDIVMLIADNPSYPPYIITKDNPARIIGKAVRLSVML